MDKSIADTNGNSSKIDTKKQLHLLKELSSKSVSSSVIAKKANRDTTAPSVLFLSQLKSNTRALLHYLHCNSSDDSYQYKDMIDANNIILQYEEKLQLWVSNDSSSNTMSSDRLLELTMELCKIKETATMCICDKMLNHLPPDLICKYISDHKGGVRSEGTVRSKRIVSSNIDNMLKTPEVKNSSISREVQTLLNFFETFTSVEKRNNRVNLISSSSSGSSSSSSSNNNSSSVAVELLEKSVFIDRLQSDISRLTNELLVKEEKLTSLTKSSVRNDIIIYQQKQIDDLTTSNANLSIDVVKLGADNNLLMATLSQMSDRYAASKNQLNEMRQQYSNDVTKLQPVIQDLVNNKQAVIKQLEAASNEAQIGFVRAKYVEKGNAQLRTELNTVNEAKDTLTSELMTIRKAYETLDNEKKRLERINLVLVSAKMKFHNLYTENGAKLRTLQQDYDQLNSLHIQKCTAYDDTIKRMQDMTVEMDKAVTKSIKLDEQCIVISTYNKALELSVHDMSEEIKSFNGTGGVSNEKRVEWDNLVANSNRLHATIDRMKKDIGKYIQRIAQLEGQLKNAKIDRDQIEMELNKYL